MNLSDLTFFQVTQTQMRVGILFVYIYNDGVEER
jgi:hypothetical protein